MNAKNLPLKFTFLALLVAVCIWLPLNRGLKWGIDLRGGHSLTFEIRTNAEVVNRLNLRLGELDQKLKQTTDDKQKKVLTETIQRLKGDLERAKADAASDTSLAEDMIRILKVRVDPDGTEAFEWRPVGANRFEVRMPAGSEKTQKAKDAYRREIQALESRNIERSHLRNLEQGRTTIEKLARGDKKLAGLLGDMLSAFKTLDQKRKSGETKIQQYIGDWEIKEEKVLQYNIATQRLISILSGYVRETDLAKVRNQPKARKALEERQTGYNRSIETFLQDHDEVRRLEAKLAKLNKKIEKITKPEDKKDLVGTTASLKGDIAKAKKDNPDRAAAIEKVINSYRAWADMRQELEDPSDLKRLITKAGTLEFRIAPVLSGSADEEQEALPASERTRYIKILRDTLEKEGPQGLARRVDRYMWFPIRGDRKSGYASMLTYMHDGQKYLLLSNYKGKTLLQRRDADKWALTDAYWTSDEKGLPAVGFRMNQAGAKLLHALTNTNKGEHMAILLDSEVYSAPVIQATISSNGIITMGTYNSEDVGSLIRILRAGSLPAKLNEVPVAESSFGPTFGKANRDMGFRAGIIGLIAVAIFMCFYYRIAGVVAIIALLLNIIMVLGAMSILGARLTLPGIAGIILTVGIAVDANVLIFERLREEQQRGTAIRRAMANAYQRAFSAIFDANITTLITCLILGWVGTEEVRGFAITLAFGVMFSMFTALVVTRWIFQVLLDRKIIDKSLNMMQVIGVPNVNWMAKRHFFWALSTAMVVIGMLSVWGQGSNLLGIEFSSGTQAVITFKDDALIDGKLPTAELVRTNFMETVKKLANKDPKEYGKLAETETTKIETRFDYNKVENFLKNRDRDNDKKITLTEFKALPQANADFFKLVDTNSDNTLDNDELQGLPETSYQVTTTEVSVPKISKVGIDTFGASLKRRISYLPESANNAKGYVVVKDEMIAELDLKSNDKGYALVRPASNTPHTPTMEDFSDGVVIALRGLSPRMTQRELQERIENTQMQPDFAKGIQNRVKVAALATGAEGGKYSDFAVFSRPEQKSQSTESVASELSTLLTESLLRDEATVAINFDAAIASGAAQSAILAIVLSWLAIVLYVWVRFGSIRWGLAAVVCLIHDVVIVVGLLAASVWIADTTLGGWLGIGSFKIDLAMVAAILTVIGYSVNDTIVVFDRIRENRGKLATISVMSLNSSINQTLGRTLLTSMTTLIVVLIMYIFGGDAIRPFSFALLVGVLFGTYSSVAIASPLLMGLRKALMARTAGMTEEQNA